MPTISHTARHPHITIVISFYNPGAVFLGALKSVFAQTVSDWELILIDDGSTDGSERIASRLHDDRVTVIRDGKNRGLSRRLNQGAQLAQGQFLFRMDADDIMHPERLSEELKVLLDSSDNTVVGSACYSIDANSKVVGWRPAEGKLQTGYASRHSFFHPTVAARTSWFRNNPYSESRVYRRAEDAELWCRTSSVAEFKWIQRPLQYYRELGVFSLSNYLATEKGLLQLIEEVEESRVQRILLAARERVKMWIAWWLTKLNSNDLMVRRRLNRLDEEERRVAERWLEVVMKTELPLA